MMIKPDTILSYLKTYTFLTLFKLVLRKPQKTVLKLRNNIKMFIRFGTQDSGTVSETWIDKPYMKKINELKGNIIDIGANIGSFTIFASTFDTQVYSYEPIQRNYGLMKKSVEINKINNIHTFRLAVGGVSGKTRIYHGDQTGKHSSYIKSENYEEVQTITLINIMDKIKECFLLKIDCEGAEYDILYSTPKKYLQRIKNIAMEYHNVKGRSKKGLIQYLNNNGFKVFDFPVMEGIGMIYAKLK